ncbi:hypothetical protein ABT278_28150 [Streptomyces sp. NPDC001228]|uniref:hypothetical protein n=1 Tax=Streptomyces sp. NPDC001228 TaxID=3154381 RepID=UPI0033236238
MRGRVGGGLRGLTGVTGVTGAARTVSTPDSGWLASGTDAAMKVGATLKDGHQYGWDVYSEDDSADQNLTSAKSEHCWFNTDFTAPQTPEVTGNPSFPQVGSDRTGDVVYAGPKKTTAFTVAGADAPASDDSCDPGTCKSSGMASFLWQLDSPPCAADGTPAAVTGTDSQGRSTATIPVPIQDWGVHTLYVAGVDKAGNISTSPAGYTFVVPWDPATTIKPGDISGDGMPDLLATTKTGDFDLIPGDRDPAQTTAPAQSGPVDGTPPDVTGPVTVSTPVDSPDGTGWNNYLIAHRGNMHGANGDDLWAYDRTTGELYVVKNDLAPSTTVTSRESPGPRSGDSSASASTASSRTPARPPTSSRTTPAAAPPTTTARTGTSASSSLPGTCSGTPTAIPPSSPWRTRNSGSTSPTAATTSRTRSCSVTATGPARP